MDKKQCPLCGGQMDDNDELFCSRCNENAKQRDTLDLLTEEDSNLEPNDDSPVPVTPATEKQEEKNQPPHDKKNKKKKKTIFFISALAVSLFLAGIVIFFIFDKKRKEANNIELTFWFSSIEENTPQSYSKYLQAYPNGQFSSDAQLKIAELRRIETEDWIRLKKSDNLQSYYSFIDKYPATPFKNEIKHIMDSLSWIMAERDNTAESYLVYIENYNLGNISGYYASIAEKRREYLKHTKRVEGEELAAVKEAITNYFHYLSAQSYSKLTDVFPATVSNFYGEKNHSSAKIIKTIQADAQKNSIKSLSYTPDFEVFAVSRDSLSVYFTDLNVEKHIVYEKKKKKVPETIKERLRIELTPELYIKSVFMSPAQNK